MITRGSDRLTSFVPRVAATWDGGSPWTTVDGSLVFVDISGFTALSERLATLGAVGAEILTETLGECFTDLLAVAYGRGGSLLKFGGDALLLMFDGEGHVQRACDAALGMRARLREIGGIKTDAGSVRLRMSVGVHSGLLHLFRVGGSHKELIIAGPAASTVVEMETTATAGEIVVSNEVIGAVPKSSRGEQRGTGWLLRGRATETEGYPPAREVTADAAELLPIALRSHLIAGDVGAEHRLVSVGFLRFEGIDDVIGGQGPDAASAALDGLVSAAQNAADARGVTFLGTDVDRNGGKIIFVAGAPSTAGGDEDRITAALREITAATGPLAVRAGVNRGHVFAGEIGPAYRRTYTVMGDAVNLAARLMSSAEPGQLLASREVIELCEADYETTPLPPFKVKGKNEPVTAVVVGAPKGNRGGSRADHAFVGREEESSRLLEHWDRALAGRGSRVVIGGDAGIGRSRLLGELCARIDARAVHIVRCERIGASIPLHAVRGLLHSLMPDLEPTDTWLFNHLEETAPSLTRWAPLIGAALGIDVPDNDSTRSLEPRFRRTATARAIADLISALCDEATLIAFEDVERIDDASQEVLDELNKRIDSSPWLLILTRGGDLTDADITLAPLTETDAGLLVDAVAGDAAIPPHQRKAIVARAQGNPLFLIELTRVALEGPGTLPDSLEAVVAVEIDALGPEDRRLLRIASVLGVEVDVDLLVEVAGRDARRRAGRLRHLLRQEGASRLRFAHRLIADVAYAGAPFSLRRRIHAAAAAALQARPEDARPEVLSLHQLHGGLFRDCVISATTAAARAADAYANVEAIDLYERALSAARRDATTSPHEIARINERLGNAAMLLGLYDRAEVAFRDAMRVHADSSAPPEQIAERYAQVAMDRARVAFLRRRSSAAMRWISKGIKRLDEIADSAPSAGSARAHLLLLKGFHHQQNGDPRRALRFAAEAIEVSRASGDTSSLADGLMLHDWSCMALGRSGDASDGSEALALLEELGDLRRLAILVNNLGGVAYYQGRWTEAVAMYERARDALEAVGNTLETGAARSNIAEILIDQERLDEAERLLTEAAKLYRSFDYTLGEALIARHRAKIVARVGDVPSALEILGEARTALDAAGHTATVAEVDAWTAWTLLSGGRVDEARSVVAAALAAHRSGSRGTITPMLLRVRAFISLSEGDTEAARSDATESLRAARERDAAYDIASALDTLIAAGDDDPAIAAERDEIFARLGVRRAARPLDL